VPLGPDYVNRIRYSLCPPQPVGLSAPPHGAAVVCLRCVTFGMPFVGCEKLGDLVQRHRCVGGAGRVVCVWLGGRLAGVRLKPLWLHPGHSVGVHGGCAGGVGGGEAAT